METETMAEIVLATVQVTKRSIETKENPFVRFSTRSGMAGLHLFAVVIDV